MRILVAVAVVAGCYRGAVAPPPPPPSAPATPAAPVRGITLADPLGFLPGDADVLFVVDVKRFRASPLWARVEPLIRKRASAFTAGVAGRCKFDPIDSVTWISVAMSDVKSANSRGALVIRGYDRDVFMKCVELARSPNTVTIDRGIVTITDSTRLVFTFADATTLVAIFGPNSSAEALRGVLDGGAPLRLVPWLGELLASTDTTAPAWFAYNGSFASSPLGASGARSLAGSVALDGGVASSIRMRFDAPDKAAATANLMQGQIAGAKSFFEELAVDADDLDVVIRIRASNVQAEMLLGLLNVP